VLRPTPMPCFPVLEHNFLRVVYGFVKREGNTCAMIATYMKQISTKDLNPSSCNRIKLL
jgi:hypothetical protein